MWQACRRRPQVLFVNNYKGFCFHGRASGACGAVDCFDIITTTTTPHPFYGAFSGITSGLYGARED